MNSPPVANSWLFAVVVATPSDPPSLRFTPPTICQIARRLATIAVEPSSELIVVLTEQVLPTVVEAVVAQGTLKSSARSVTVPFTDGPTPEGPLPLSVIRNVALKRKSPV